MRHSLCSVVNSMVRDITLGGHKKCRDKQCVMELLLTFSNKSVIIETFIVSLKRNVFRSRLHCPISTCGSVIHSDSCTQLYLTMSQSCQVRSSILTTQPHRKPVAVASTEIGQVTDCNLQLRAGNDDNNDQMAPLVGLVSK